LPDFTLRAFLSRGKFHRGNGQKGPDELQFGAIQWDCKLISAREMEMQWQSVKGLNREVMQCNEEFTKISYDTLG